MKKALTLTLTAALLTIITTAAFAGNIVIIVGSKNDLGEAIRAARMLEDDGITVSRVLTAQEADDASRNDSEVTVRSNLHISHDDYARSHNAINDFSRTDRHHDSASHERSGLNTRTGHISASNMESLSSLARNSHRYDDMIAAQSDTDSVAQHSIGSRITDAESVSSRIGSLAAEKSAQNFGVSAMSKVK